MCAQPKHSGKKFSVYETACTTTRRSLVGLRQTRWRQVRETTIRFRKDADMFMRKKNHLYYRVKTEGRTKYLKCTRAGCDGSAKLVGGLRLNSTTRTLSETRTDPTEFLGDPGRKKVRAVYPMTDVSLRQYCDISLCMC